jgi:beta-galactosidase
VKLHLTGPVYQTPPLYGSLGTTGTYIWSDVYDVPGAGATVHASSEVRNDGKASMLIRYAVMVRNLDGKVVATFDGDRHTIAPGMTATLSAQRRLAELYFWSWGRGYLYAVTTALKDAEGRVIDAVGMSRARLWIHPSSDAHGRMVTAIKS